MAGKTALIIGAGPAGLTAAYELVQRTDILPVVIDSSSQVGGLAKTINVRGNRIDIGGHRFFSKSKRVMKWWNDILPFENADDSSQEALSPSVKSVFNRDKPGPGDERVMLLRPRKSRILFRGRLFDYPLSLSINTVKGLGVMNTMLIGLSYLAAKAHPVTPELSLEDFFVNRFGRRLFETFFRAYSEKVWGLPCAALAADWGRQRVKGLSIKQVLLDVMRRMSLKPDSVDRGSAETSLIQSFWYPKLGPGQLWEETARLVAQKGGRILLEKEVCEVACSGDRISDLVVRDVRTGEVERLYGDLVLSTMALGDLFRALKPAAPEEIRQVAEGLLYRDFIIIGVLLKSKAGTPNMALSDNWIYVQEPALELGRIQIFNNWSSGLVADPNTLWLGLEYFCNTGDRLWNMSDADMAAFGIKELKKTGLLPDCEVLDSLVVRIEKAYPVYSGSYARLGLVRNYLNRLENLIPIGRNGMHRYNNQDHSMLTAMTAVDNLVAGRTDHSNLWLVNSEQEYHE